MSKIHLLSEHVCNKIAAGEVVERPASVVKELVENALDAGSGKISIRIEKAGQKLIAVQDNGEGMDPDDALLCLESHATSKITREEDIFAIHSFGFRGEALPSIASVSKISIRTRRKDAPEGVEVVVNAGKLISQQPAGCAPGTEVVVRDLFCNLPARRKFLRSEATEERHIIECVTSITLANSSVSFDLKLDGRNLISSPGADKLDSRLRDLFGKQYADAMIPVDKTEYGIHVSGFISKRSFTRNSRNDQRTFVNGRCIESPAIYRGIREGCGPTLEQGRYAAAVLFLTMSPGEVDVNVHPAKREVRFRKEFEVTTAVRSAVAEALRNADPVLAPAVPSPFSGGSFISNTKLYPDFSTEKLPSGTDSSLSPRIEDLDLRMIFHSALVEYTPLAARGNDYSSGTRQSEEVRLFPEENDEETLPANNDLKLETEDVRPAAPCSDPNIRLLGVLENSYLVGTIPGGLVLIDQHAAHERVLFERILKGVDGVFLQKLLLPITLEVSRADMQFVIRNLADFEKIGFEIEPFGEHTLKLNGIPAAIRQENAGGFFQDILSRLADDGAVQKSAVERIARAACKAAVKAHDTLSMEECGALLKQLGQCELPFSCPHGRPTILNISLNEIERRFGRK